MTSQEFAQRVKSKYPDYGFLQDQDLVQRIVSKYPDYAYVIDDLPQPIKQQSIEQVNQIEPVQQLSQNAQAMQPIQQAQQGFYPEPAEVTQAYGNYNPQLEPNPQGINTGLDIGLNSGTPLSVPEPGWQVQEAVNQFDPGTGWQGNFNANQGYGNSVMLFNPKTNEKLRFSHLDEVMVMPGDELPPGTIFGKSGLTGNTTGPHLDTEYYNSQGQHQDPLQSPYSKYFPIKKNY